MYLRLVIGYELPVVPYLMVNLIGSVDRRVCFIAFLDSMDSLPLLCPILVLIQDSGISKLYFSNYPIVFTNLLG